ncbi:four helix bundle protein [Porphyromonadaceae bacterium]
MKQYQYGFEKLDVWQDARELVVTIYKLCQSLPANERFGLSSQMQRASVSIVSNIAEGVSRNSTKEKCRFLEVAYGSAIEVYCQLIVIKDLCYISEEEYGIISAKIQRITNKVNALSKSIQKKGDIVCM